ncbi:SNG1 family protein [Aspergillus undulatus]|uniref:SNG1 family protein n=1 Tax=Aspergillus undulatus TaxID=1810928 RepID=UPI003CCCA545
MAGSARNDRQGRFPKPFVIAVGMSFIMLQLLFLANLSYIYATQFENNSRIHNLKLLYVDFDGGAIGASVMDAYGALRGPGFPTLQQSSVDEYHNPSDVRDAICEGDYWAAIMATEGASDRLAAALAGDTETALQIAASNPAQELQPALSYIWNGVRFPALSQGFVYSNIQALVQVTRSTYYARNASSAMQSIAATANSTSGPNQASVQAFLSPIPAEEIDIQPTHQGARVLYNTVTIIMPILMQFFFIMALNNISAEFGILTQHSAALTNGLLRLCLGVLYNAIGGLCTAGYIWAFRESWAVGRTDYALTWLVLWLYGHVNFLVLDTATAYIPMPFIPFFVLTWVIINISTTIAPFELSPGFFKWGYALPAHEFYEILVQIWSGGCVNRLYRALPILFSWWLVAMVGSVFGGRHRLQSWRASAIETRPTVSSPSWQSLRRVLGLELGLARGLTRPGGIPSKRLHFPHPSGVNRNTTYAYA